MNFSEAIEALKEGRKVARAGWNGKGMFVFMTPESYVPYSKLRDHMQRHLVGEVHSPDQRIKINAHLDMRAADGTIVIGWLASQTDMLAEDWEIVV